MVDRPPRPQVQALLQAVKSTPDDDTPRLVLADWLQENGDENDVAHGEFIRLQCERAKKKHSEARDKDMRRREDVLRRRHSAAWLGPLVEMTQHVAFSRGLFQIVAEGRLLASKQGIELTATEACQWIDSLTFNHATGPALVKLAATPLLNDLDILSLRDAKIRAEGAKAVASSACLSRLRKLDLHWCWIEDAGVTALTNRRKAGRLAHLDLGQNMIGPAGAKRLANWIGVSSLTHLSLAVNRIEARGAQALAASTHLTNLVHLDLRNCFIGDAGAQALAESPNLPNLVSLDLVYNQIGDTGATALALSPHLKSLKVLHLGLDQRISTSTREALQKRFALDEGKA